MLDSFFVFVQIAGAGSAAKILHHVRISVVIGRHCTTSPHASLRRKAERECEGFSGFLYSVDSQVIWSRRRAEEDKDNLLGLSRKSTLEPLDSENGGSCPYTACELFK